MGEKAPRHIDARAGGLISYSTRKLPQGQADSLASRIYRRIVEEHGGIDNFINLSRWPRTTLTPEPEIASINRTMFAVGTSVCFDTQSKLVALRTKLQA